MGTLSNFFRLVFQKYFFDSLYINIPGGLTFLVQLAVLPIALKYLRVEDYGLFQFVFALQAWLDILTAPYITLGAKRGIARGLDGTLLFAFFSRLKFTAVISVFVVFGAFFVYRHGSQTLALLLLVMSLFFVSGSLAHETFRQFFIAKKQFFQFAFWKSAIAVIPPIGGTISAVVTQNIIVFAIVQLSLASLLSIAAFLYVLLRNGIVSSWRRGAIDKDIFPFGVKLIPSGIAVASAEKGAELIIGPLFGFGNLAVFSIAAKLQAMFENVLITSYYLFYADFAKEDWDMAVMKIKRKLLQGLVLAAFVTALFLIAGYMYITVFLPASYQMAKVYLLIFSAGLPPLVLYGVMRALLEANLRHKELTILSVLPSSIKLFLILAAGYFFGILGIVWGITIAAWVSFAFYYVFTTNRKFHDQNALSNR